MNDLTSIEGAFNPPQKARPLGSCVSSSPIYADPTEFNVLPAVEFRAKEAYNSRSLGVRAQALQAKSLRNQASSPDLSVFDERTGAMF